MMIINKFDQQKKKQLSKSDKSNIGEWDKKIAGLCNKINKKKNYYTTSSCSGRIVLLKESDTKQPDAFLYRTHDKISFEELKKAIDELNYDSVEFQQTSCILHVACKTLEDAQEIVDKAKLAGWKRSGIMTTKKRYMVELHSTESISFPLIRNKRLLVDVEFLKTVVEVANKKLERVWEKIERLKRLI
jgi:tRNA wybutosine-synthesizing protein 3